MSGEIIFSLLFACFGFFGTVLASRWNDDIKDIRDSAVVNLTMLVSEVLQLLGLGVVVKLPLTDDLSQVIILVFLFLNLLVVFWNITQVSRVTENFTDIRWSSLTIQITSVAIMLIWIVMALG